MQSLQIYSKYKPFIGLIMPVVWISCEHGGVVHRQNYPIGILGNDKDYGKVRERGAE